MFRAGNRDRTGSENANWPGGDQDVGIARLTAAIHYAIHQKVIEDQKRAAIATHRYVNRGQCRDLLCPSSSGINDYFTSQEFFFTRVNVTIAKALCSPVFDLDSRDFAVGFEPRTLGDRGFYVRQDQLERIDVSVGTGISLQNILREVRFQCECLIRRQPFDWNSDPLATLYPNLYVLRIVAAEMHEQTSSVVYTSSSDPLQNEIFRDALFGGIRVFYNIATTAV